MAWPSARYKTAANGGSWVPADMNGVQDQYVRSAGIQRDDLEQAITQQLGLTTTGAGHGGAAVRRGKSIIATEESRTNTAYGTLTTPDRVVDVVLPTDGLIVVAYQALVKSSVNDAGRVAIHIGSDQLKIASADHAAPQTQAAPTEGTDQYTNLATFGGGLFSGGSVAATSPVTTGQVVGIGRGTGNFFHELGGSVGTVASGLAQGGPCLVFAAAGTYHVTVQFKASSGSVTAKDRKLWVWTVGF